MISKDCIEMGKSFEGPRFHACTPPEHDEAHNEVIRYTNVRDRCLTCCLLSHLLPARSTALPVARLLPARPAWHSTHICMQVRLYLETGELMTEEDEMEWEMLAEQYGH